MTDVLVKVPIFRSTSHFDAPPLSITDPQYQWSSNLHGVWANDGSDKVAKEERRLFDSQTVTNSIWDGQKVTQFGAKNEVVSVCFIFEAGASTVSNISLDPPTFVNKIDGSTIGTVSRNGADSDELFDFRDRNIEFFWMHTLQILGLSRVSYATSYDELHVPEKLQRPHTISGAGRGVANTGTTWTDRPDHDLRYPEICIPIEGRGNVFDVIAGECRLIWMDVYIPKSASAGEHISVIKVRENGSEVGQIPVHLDVKNFTLPDANTNKNMLYFGYSDLRARHFNKSSLNTAEQSQMSAIRDNYFKTCHRHRITLIDPNYAETTHTANEPRAEWIPRLNGTLFTPANGYEGPGAGFGVDIFCIQPYGRWKDRSWWGESESAMRSNCDGWVAWFAANFPGTEYFLYIHDEPKTSTDYSDINTWLSWVNNNPGVGSAMPTMVTIDFPLGQTETPNLTIDCAHFNMGVKTSWESSATFWKTSPRKAWMYNAKRPSMGTFATDDEGVALRMLSYVQSKKNIERWFFWNACYWTNDQHSEGATNLWQQARTFGLYTADDYRGNTGTQHSNGDGVLLYPGTDLLFPSNNYGLNGPFVSLRLKQWRRGIQDMEYLELAKTVNPVTATAERDALVPEVVWEIDAWDSNDPSYQYGGPSYPLSMQPYENFRASMAQIIEDASPVLSTDFYAATGSIVQPTIAVQSNTTISPAVMSGSSTMGFSTPSVGVSVSVTPDVLSSSLSFLLSTLDVESSVDVDISISVLSVSASFLSGDVDVSDVSYPETLSVFADFVSPLLSLDISYVTTPLNVNSAMNASGASVSKEVLTSMFNASASLLDHNAESQLSVIYTPDTLNASAGFSEILNALDITTSPVVVVAQGEMVIPQLVSDDTTTQAVHTLRFPPKNYRMVLSKF